MPKVLISDKLSPAAAKIFEDRGLEVDVRPGLSSDELIAVIGEYDGLAIRSATRVTREVLAAASKLRVIGRAGIGVDNVDIEAATTAGVVVMNTPFGNSVTTAEHAIAMMMALARDIPAADRSTRAGKWEKSRFMGVEVTGKTLGVIGCGNIGAIVAGKALGLGLRVIAFDPFLTEERAGHIGVEKVELDILVERADIITLHTPLTEQTRNILSRERLAACRKGVRIINCARGGLVDEEALAELIIEGHIAGAALDVFASEPARSSPLFELEQVIVTPHLGASTAEAQEKVALQVAEQMSDYLVNGAIVNALNMPSVSAEEAPRLKPYMRLAEQLGSFAGQLTETGLKSVTISYCGHVAGLNTRPLTQIILKGLLAPLMASVNMVNAPAVARSRSIGVTTSECVDVDAYQTLICLTVETERGTRDLHGTLVHGADPRIVRMRGIDIEASLGAHMLYVRNNDKPGFVGDLGRVLGDAGINIGTFHLGRSSAGGEAIALVDVDSDVSEELRARIAALPNVLQVKHLNF